MKSIFLFLAGLFFLSTTAHCQETDLLNLHYGQHSQQTLDLFLPESYSKATAVIVMLHGGGWVMGGKEYTDKRAKDLRDRGFIVANVDYRYVSETVHCKDLLNDIEDAVSYLDTQSKDLNFSSSNYHLAGISAGAHLALLYSYTSKTTVLSVSALCAPIRLDTHNDLIAFKNKGILRNVELLAGQKYIEGQPINDAFTQASPYIHAHGKQVATLLIHGDKDDLVPSKHSTFLYQFLQKVNAKEKKLVIMEGKGHDVGLNEPDSERFVYDEITDWINKHNE